MRSILPALFKGLLAAVCLGASALPGRAENNPRAYAVEVSATVQTFPPQINLRWPTDVNATGYSIYRKTFAGTSWSLLANLAGGATSWSDLAVGVGSSYEYAILKTTSAGYKGTGYIYSGINSPLTDARGKVVLIVDSTHSAALAAELARLQQDLVGDGWTVLRHDVARSATPVQVKNLIKADYNADPANVKSVLLFGHIPVPYSGNFNPDGHPDHKGAWVADTYYGDMDGSWTDSSVNNTGAEKPWNDNVPGDGKFDQSDIPSDLELQVGRVDLSNLTCYANKTPARSELDLLRAYLDKHHAFRHGQIVLNRRGLVSDNFGERDGEAFAATGWRNFAPFFGAENNVPVAAGGYFGTLKDNAYLWSYGTGGGGWHSCNGVGGSDDFAVTPIRSVFTSYLGSYFGDWDNESAFMRAALGSGYVLATAWGGRPHWFFHHMGLGETIGHSARLSQNNRQGGLYAAQNYGTRGVHVTLLGDPTLRMHPVIPPAGLSATAGAGVTVSWTASTDANIQGYLVYRASSASGPFTRISGSSLLTTTSFTDHSGAAGQFYMVRAVKLESSGSGTYYNPSQGVFATAAASPAPTPTPSDSAVFVNEDRTTSGAWKSRYGSEGFAIARSTTNLPSNVTLSISDALTWVWPYSKAALETEPGPGQIASCWYAGAIMNVQLRFSDDQTHRVALYLHDKEFISRRQTIDVLDNNGTVLATRFVENFGAGTYLVWDLRGTVIFRFQNNGPLNCVLSGIFFGTAGISQPPAPAGQKVRFLGADTTTRGAWKGTFGSQGFQLVAEGSNLPAWATLSATGKSDHVWNWNTLDLSALQKASAPDRLASCWYSYGAMDLKLNLTDGQARKISFYSLDWDQRGRSQRVEVLDPATGAILHSTTLTGFQSGTYLSYDVKGAVTFRFVNTGPANCVMGGWFIDPASAPL